MPRIAAPTAAVDAYLARLDAQLRDLPRERRAEIVADIRDHIESAMDAEDGAAGEVEVRNVLERLGDPGDIAEDARQRFGVARQRGVAWQDWSAPWLLALGTSVFLVGWFVGVAFLWRSTLFRRWEKVVATAIWPLGMALPFFAAGVIAAFAGTQGTGGLLLVLYGAPVVVATYLTGRLILVDRARSRR